MFVNAIETAGQFTRAVHQITRNYGESVGLPSAATLFFVNPEGWAITCRHVAEFFVAGDMLSLKRKAFAADLAAGLGKQKEKILRRELERKHSTGPGNTIEARSGFVGCIEGPLALSYFISPVADLALLKFSGYSRLSCESFPVFPKNTGDLKPGKFLCRLGFPFPEFDNFTYNRPKDELEWTSTGRNSSPRFPIEGMVTRFLLNPDETRWGFEMSTPGLKGQSGGPAFDTTGKVWGLQCSTRHLDLDFDVNIEVDRMGKKKRISESAILHVGQCVHVEVIKRFMLQHGVKFNEA